jgi:CHAT domain-containing protein
MRHRVLFAIGLIVVAGAASVFLKGFATDFVIRIELARAIEASNRAYPLDLQFADDHDLARAIAALLPVPKAAQRARLLSLAFRRPSETALHARGVALLLSNRPTGAIESLSAISPARRSPSMWTNLAVAESRATAPERNHDHLLASLVAIDEALAVNPVSVEAVHDRQLILRSIGLVLGHEDDEALWKRKTGHIGCLSDDELDILTRSYPQQARRYAEGSYLGEWADAVNRGAVAESEAILHRIEIIANALHSNGEGFLFDVVSSINTARRIHDVARIRATAVALDLYRRGRLATRDHAATSAATTLVRARDALAAAGSPMAALADCYVAINLIDSNRGTEARQLLVNLVAAQRVAATSHPALLALARYHTALIDARSGNWSDSLTAANESMEIFRRLRERGLVGTVEGLLSQDYEFLGQPQLAWQHGIAGLELSLRAGDPTRARATLAALSRAELRNNRWSFARALIHAEQLIAYRVDDVPQTCDMLIRVASAEDHLGHSISADAALTAARRRAQTLADPALRAKLVADVDAAAGSLLRKDPGRALPLLTSAISFQEIAGRAIVLPALLLERGRAELALGRDIDASRDFEAGISALEQQRSRTTAAELRPGIFDNASELFDEAVSLALRQGMPAAAFAYVERSRARAVLEEIVSTDARPSPLASSEPAIGDVMRALGPDDLLIEYASLDDRLVMFVIDRSLCTFTITCRRSIARRDAESLMAALDERRPQAEIEEISARVYSALIGHIRDRLTSKRNLIVIGDASLQQLPFAALYDTTTRRFLIEDHPIVTAPSAAVYALSARRHALESPTPPTAAIFANPLPHAAPFEFLAPLTASESEGLSIARRYGKMYLAVRDQATVSTFKNVAPTFDVVHFAGHAVRYPTEPWRSALLFASSSRDDGTLSVEQVAHLRFTRTRIVILAACSTLRAQKSGVEGVPSLARAFLVAGVPSVIGTLSDVDDFEAAPLLSELHNGIRHGLAPADALRAAQLAVLRGDDPALRHPGYWSAFALLGSGVQ